MTQAIPSPSMSEQAPTMELDADDDGASLARLAARTADEKKGDDIIVLEVGEVLAIAGYFVIASASNGRLVQNLAEEIERAGRAAGRAPVRTEGHREKQWVLIDYGDVIVHVFHKEMRDFYEIERLYGDVPRLEWAS